MTAIKEALIANEPKTAPIDPRFPNTNQVRRTHQTTFGAPASGAQGVLVPKTTGHEC